MQSRYPHSPGSSRTDALVENGASGRMADFDGFLTTSETILGGVLITGGKGKEQETFLLSGLALKTWLQRADMLTPRIGHAAVSLQLDGKETVMVAGGWDQLGRTLSSVEIFLVGENVWQEFIAMPSPRADFSLQARSVQTSEYLKDHIDR